MSTAIESPSATPVFEAAAQAFVEAASQSARVTLTWRVVAERR
jgi:hypothetical protein